ncbi:LEM3/CDC50 family protein [Basidiobolus meristosporus CBS 931.73]|uniref:LEM3/CDC50 family protein n=1 Tax=Basidiobolus meristosporus CBS 931.73 TaxID=1314790 RepID=A0A1Y1XZQ4_9FUNG|nr:LEM3/CDC50 family protein [Basidiobolus meristosporus CBS 931.73]|eukprot:ORX91145.1 LEM3/CDC50 family protein [Basidiobolus meristosporus CBS 931.73]
MEPEVKSKKPANTAFKQQRLKAWQPILTPKTVLPTLFIVGIIFAPIGGLLLYASDNVNELTIDYTNCINAGATFQNIPKSDFSASFSKAGQMSVPQYRVENASLRGGNPNGLPAYQCHIQFEIPKDLKPPVFLYYRLTHFFQNHRRYVKSFDVEQLKGSALSAGTLSGGSCDPLAVAAAPTPEDPNRKLPIYPCGLIANSMFNDTIYDLTLDPNGAKQPYTFSANGIAWKSDSAKYKKTSYKPNEVLPPPNWAKQYPNGTYTDAYPPPDISTDEHFQVWMRTAGLPNFRKLYGRNENEPMKKGLYEVTIEMNFDVTRFGGSKAIVISTVSFLGGKNPFLGIAYIVVGCVCVLLGCIFTARHLYKPRKLGDHSYLSWNQNNGPSSSAAIGAQGFNLSER